jgi:hypothetical protein
MNDVAGTLEKAADILETVGWTQGASVHYEPAPDGSLTHIAGFCATGALYRARCNGIEYDNAVSAMAYEIVGDYTDPRLDGKSWLIGLRSATVVEWNDTPGRTKYEVIDMMRRTAKNLRNEAVPE